MVSKKFLRNASFVLLGLLLLGAALVSGCSQKQAAQTPSAALTGSLTIAGSTSVQPFSDVLAEQLMASNPGLKINVQGGGSAVGISSALSGAADLGAISSALSPAQQSQGLVGTTIALDGIAIVVNPSNTLTDLTTAQVMNIYLGNIKNWKDVGGPDAPITLVTREAGSGTRDAFKALVLGGKDIIPTAIVQNSTGAIATTVAGDKNAIGYVSLASVNSTVKAVVIDGVVANVANVKNGTYKLQRPFIYLTKGAPTGLAKSYLDFVLSPAGQKIIVDNGAVSINQ